MNPASTMPGANTARTAANGAANFLAHKRRVGRSGLTLSPLGLGTLTWGRDTDEYEARALIELFVENNGSTIDTAASFADEQAEKVIGKIIGDLGVREHLTIISKAGVGKENNQRVVNAGRGQLLKQLNSSLKNLGTDYLDLWLVQRPDPATALEETLSAIDIAVNSGKALYVGLSNVSAWQYAHAATRACQFGGGVSGSAGFSSLITAVENEYSLLNRQAENEIIPAASHLGGGIIAWSALGRGVLTGRYRQGVPPTSRAASSHLRGFVEPYMDKECAGIVEALATAAQGLERTISDCALSWTLAQPQIACALIGPRTVSQLQEILQGDFSPLPAQVMEALDDVSWGRR